MRQMFENLLRPEQHDPAFCLVTLFHSYFEFSPTARELFDLWKMSNTKWAKDRKLLDVLTRMLHRLVTIVELEDRRHQVARTIVSQHLECLYRQMQWGDKPQAQVHALELAKELVRSDRPAFVRHFQFRHSAFVKIQSRLSSHAALCRVYFELVFALVSRQPPNELVKILVERQLFPSLLTHVVRMPKEWYSPTFEVLAQVWPVCSYAQQQKQLLAPIVEMLPQLLARCPDSVSTFLTRLPPTLHLPPHFYFQSEFQPFLNATHQHLWVTMASRLAAMKSATFVHEILYKHPSAFDARLSFKYFAAMNSLINLTQNPVNVPLDLENRSIEDWVLLTNFGFGKCKEFSKACQHPQALVVFLSLTCVSGFLSRVAQMLEILKSNQRVSPTKIVAFQTTLMSDYLPSREVLISILNKTKSASTLIQHRCWKVFQQYQQTFRSTLAPARFEITKMLVYCPTRTYTLPLFHELISGLNQAQAQHICATTPSTSSILFVLIQKMNVQEGTTNNNNGILPRTIERLLLKTELFATEGRLVHTLVDALARASLNTAMVLWKILQDICSKPFESMSTLSSGKKTTKLRRLGLLSTGLVRELEHFPSPEQEERRTIVSMLQGWVWMDRAPHTLIMTLTEIIPSFPSLVPTTSRDKSDRPNKKQRHSNTHFDFHATWQEIIQPGTTSGRACFQLLKEQLLLKQNDPHAFALQCISYGCTYACLWNETNVDSAKMTMVLELIHMCHFHLLLSSSVLPSELVYLHHHCWKSNSLVLKTMHWLLLHSVQLVDPTSNHGTWNHTNNPPSHISAWIQRHVFETPQVSAAAYGYSLMLIHEPVEEDLLRFKVGLSWIMSKNSVAVVSPNFMERLTKVFLHELATKPHGFVHTDDLISISFSTTYQKQLFLAGCQVGVWSDVQLKSTVEHFTPKWTPGMISIVYYLVHWFKTLDQMQVLEAFNLSCIDAFFSLGQDEREIFVTLLRHETSLWTPRLEQHVDALHCHGDGVDPTATGHWIQLLLIRLEHSSETLPTDRMIGELMALSFNQDAETCPPAFTQGLEQWWSKIRSMSGAEFQVDQRFQCEFKIQAKDATSPMTAWITWIAGSSCSRATWKGLVCCHLSMSIEVATYWTDLFFDELDVFLTQVEHAPEDEAHKMLEFTLSFWIQCCACLDTTRSSGCTLSLIQLRRLLTYYHATCSRLDQSILYLVKHHYGLEALISIEFRFGSSLARQEDHERSSEKNSRWFFHQVFDPKMLKRSIDHFPIIAEMSTTQSLVYPIDDQVYDPQFLLPLFRYVVELCEDGLENVITSFALGYIFMSLASHDLALRKYGYSLVATVAPMLATQATIIHMNGTKVCRQLELLVLCMQRTIASSFERLPFLHAIFCNDVSRILSTPGHFLYPSMNQYLLSRGELDFTDLPMFYALLYSHAETPSAKSLTLAPYQVGGWAKEQKWIVQLLRRGMRTSDHLAIGQRRHVVTHLMHLFQATRTDNSLRLIILECLAHFPTHVESAEYWTVTCAGAQWVAWMLSCRLMTSSYSDQQVALKLAELGFASSQTSSFDPWYRRGYNGSTNPHSGCKGSTNPNSPALLGPLVYAQLITVLNGRSKDDSDERLELTHALLRWIMTLPWECPQEDKCIWDVLTHLNEWHLAEDFVMWMDTQPQLVQTRRWNEWSLEFVWQQLRTCRWIDRAQVSRVVLRSQQVELSPRSRVHLEVLRQWSRIDELSC